MRPFTSITGATAAALAGIGALHVMWGRGSTFPYQSSAQLTDQVTGRRSAPSPASCYAVAGALLTASTTVAGAALLGGRRARLGSAGVAAVLLTRAALGFAGRTDVVSPGSTSPSFRRLDRRVLSPLCVALGVGAATAAGFRRAR